jgi:ferredoxin
MIVAEQKPITEIAGLIVGARRVLIVGCRECVTVCLAGGEKEAETLAAALRLLGATGAGGSAAGRAAGSAGAGFEVTTTTLQRQCEPEYVGELAKAAAAADCIVSLACGVGVQYLAERYPVWVVPGLNTKFVGGAVEQGVWTEKCGLCGECVLHRTGGICPVARCSKSILNGPCGGSHDGKCEIRDDVECAWQLIYDRLNKLGRLDLLLAMEPPKDWSKARDGGPRKVTREDVRL